MPRVLSRLDSELEYSSINRRFHTATLSAACQVHTKCESTSPAWILSKKNLFSKRLSVGGNPRFIFSDAIPRTGFGEQTSSICQHVQ